MLIKNIINPDLIFVSDEATEKSEVLLKLSKILCEKGYGASEKELLTLFQERENLSSTGIGNGIAIPHIFLKDLQSSVLVIMTLKKNINFDSHDGGPVNLILALAANGTNPATHLSILAKLSRIFSKQKYYSPIIQAKTPAEILEILKDL